MGSLFNTFVKVPLYNGLIFLFGLIPWADAGVVLVIFTVLVKLVLFPLSYKASKTQAKMKLYEPELKRIREQYKDSQEQAMKIMDFYKEKGINPFSSFFLLLIQLPIIFALYFIFLKSGLPSVDTSILYPFVNAPASVDMEFLGLLNIAEKSVILALLAGITSYVQIAITNPAPKPDEEGKEKSMKDDLARMMNTQMRYMLPVMAFIISYNISGAVALYWTTSNVFAIGQELYVKKRLVAAQAQNQP